MEVPGTFIWSSRAVSGDVELGSQSATRDLGYFRHLEDDPDVPSWG